MRYGRKKKVKSLYFYGRPINLYSLHYKPRSKCGNKGSKLLVCVLLLIIDHCRYFIDMPVCATRWSLT